MVQRLVPRASNPMTRSSTLAAHSRAEFVQEQSIARKEAKRTGQPRFFYADGILNCRAFSTRLQDFICADLALILVPD